MQSSINFLLIRYNTTRLDSYTPIYLYFRNFILFTQDYGFKIINSWISGKLNL